MKMKVDDGWRDGDRNFSFYEMSISREEKNIEYLFVSQTQQQHVDTNI
jgi:hypothetical protein